ncbi:uncharacterized protein LOC141664267 [Apium graveolens]|uniref:uncharacterized protein LOC141664267 n=1 Tax=Apium graveolens TaxID=4045 RepID=UPI003D792083
MRNKKLQEIFVTMNSSFLQFILLSALLLLATSLIPKNSTAYAYLNNVTDRQALLSFKASIRNDPSEFLGSWNDSVHFCLWQGIICNHRHQRVMALHLSTQQLDGTLSPYIGNLSFLRAIYLDRNNLRGSIPPEIGKLFRLRYLHLGNNFLRGEFPMNLSHCSDIKNISIEENNLQGKLPTEFISWSKLTVFNVRKNHLTGSIPSSFGNLSSLVLLDLGSNSLTGTIPLEVAHLSNLEILRLSVNNLSGRVPLPLYNSSSLYSVSLSQNDLEGRLPTDLGLTLPNLQNFIVGENRFSGPFPPSITNASKLVRFDIPYNSINGPLPKDLGRLLSLQWLNLGHNQLGYNQPRDGLTFLDSLVNSTRLKYLGLFENGLSGELPNSIVNLSTTLDQLDFFTNNIYGSIPQDIGKLFNMTRILLDQNMLTGSIPESICKIYKLGHLRLGDNNISGVIPSCISNFSGILILSLKDNMLHGSIPTTLYNISSLQGLSLSSNHLSGVIPEQIIGLSSLNLGLHLHQNLLTGPLPSNIGRLIHLIELRLSDNKFTGEIPSSLGDCTMLDGLDMKGNLFHGRIPSSFKYLKSLEFLDLSANNMSGNIPHFLGELNLLRYLNLSQNKLGGEVPKNGVFSNLTAFSVVGNNQLCGGIQELKLPVCPANILKSKKKKFPLKIVPLVVILPVAVLLACCALLSYRHRKSTHMNAHVMVLHDDHYPRLSYQDLVLATNEFSVKNLLGEGRCGSVYKGYFESMKQYLAVKVLNIEAHGAYKSFLAECETLRNLRHRNLIKIITTCSSMDSTGKDFKALVFEYMPNGSLEKWLYPIPSEQRNLTLLQRLNIAIDMALAVEYLHHRGPARIIHCDIKPSNILLDEEFVARVGDFGLARFFLSSAGDINHAHTSSTGVRGTVGYIPPEYGMGEEISTEGDAYSFGILLLEMFSGKRPTSSSILEENANNLHDYIRNALSHEVMEIVDPRIMLDQEDHGTRKNESVNSCQLSSKMKACLALIFEVGILCSVETPRERIDINVALKKLHVAREKLLK